MRVYILLLTIALLIGCSDEPTTISALTGGQTPEWTLRQYQSLVDQNEFEAAKQFCTSAEQNRLDQLAAVMVRETLSDAVLHTDFLKINCRKKGQALQCHCLVEDEYERYELVYKLVSYRGHWLVDAPDGGGMEEEVIDGVLNSMKEVMQ